MWINLHDDESQINTILFPSTAFFMYSCAQTRSAVYGSSTKCTAVYLLKTIPPLRLWVDSARSAVHETAEAGVLETRRRLVSSVLSAELGLEAWWRLRRRLRRLVFSLLDRVNDTRRSRPAPAFSSTSSTLVSSRPTRLLVCALSYVSCSLMFLKLWDMVEAEDWEAARFPGS